MRLVIAAVASWLLLAGPARADVFVPADPRFPFGGDCVGAAGDVFAVGRSLVDGWTVQGTAGSDTVQSLLGDDAGRPVTCPAVAAAPDGTAAVTSFTTGVARLAIRRPGATFGAPTPLGRVTWPPAVAAAPGGWIAVAWTRQATGSLDSTLTVLVIPPSGRPVKTVLARGQAIGRPRVAIAPDGTAAVAWSTSRPRSTRFVADLRGGAWSAPAELPGGSGSGTGAGVALAMAPGGRRLLAWAAGDGIRVQVDGEPAATVAPVGDGSELAAALADDGAAVVAFTDGADVVRAVDRGPGGAWSAPHQLSVPGHGTSVDGGLEAILAPGGRAVVAWPVARRLAAVSGPAGGTWDVAALVSPVTRDVAAFDLTHDAAGEPWLLWIEPDHAGGGGPVRGARLAASAPADTTPPTFTVSVPRKLPATRNALTLDIPITIRCDEPCDVRAGFTRDAYSAYALRANQRTTFHLDGRSERETLLSRPGQRALRFTVTVSDRAGNVAARRRVSVPISIRPASLRSFKVPASYDFGLLSRAGNRDAVRFVNGYIEALAARRLRTTGQLRAALDRGFARLERDHEEAAGGPVHSAIYDVLAVPIRRAGFDPDRIFG
ncbi:hypothetical protein [Solirubrobacter pauli]|uniref:hypothetical protein n=1 Tax=Solirubrobacter pauli TaxID=166793 RepID=UPI000EB48B89|nr:hypothetical protein [Solirubrobacter pauli]